MDIIRREGTWVLAEFVDPTGWHYIVAKLVGPDQMVRVCTTNDLVHAHEVMNGIRDECTGTCNHRKVLA
jgi:hypothetical protein